MQVKLSSRHMDVTEALRDYAELKAGKLNKYYDRVHDVEVVFDGKKELTVVEMIVKAEHKHRFIAHSDPGDAYACVDECFAKLERQLSEHKKKFRNRKHSGNNGKR